MKIGAAFSWLLILAWLAAAAVPARIIYDTDMGNDVDDAIGLAVLHALETRGECRLLAITITKDNRYAAEFTSLLDAYYGRASIPIGVVRKGKTPDDGNYTRAVVSLRNEAGASLYRTPADDPAALPEAVVLLRRTLAKEADGAVTIVQVGFSTNLARLLDSGPDDASPLSGRELAARKVARVVVMAGHYPTGNPEYNVKTDIPAAEKLFSTWPGPIFASGFEVGNSIRYDPERLNSDFRYAAHHPLVDAYKFYQPMPYAEPLWDPTAVLYAVRPYAAYFSLSAPGTIKVDSRGATTFAGSAGGKQRYLVVDDAQRAAVREAISALMSEPPR